MSTHTKLFKDHVLGDNPIDGLDAKTLVLLYNELAEKLSVSEVKRFSHKAAGIRRTNDVIKAWREDNPKPEPEPEPEPDPVVDALFAKAEIDAARKRLRKNPPASGNPAKDAEMPSLRKALKPMNLKAKESVYPRKAGTKQALLIDLLARPEGVTFGELYDALEASGKPWRGSTIRSGLAWDVNYIAGYGIVSKLYNGEEFVSQGRDYEAKRLGMDKGVIDDWYPDLGYDPELKLPVFHLVCPEGQDGPLPHTESAKQKSL